MTHGRHSDPLQHINDDHSDDLLVVARAFGHPDATTARAERVDRHGIDLVVDTPGGPRAARVEFSEPISEGTFPDGVRVALVRLVRRARTTPSPLERDSDPL